MTEQKPYPSILQGFGICLIFFGYSILVALLAGGNSADPVHLGRSTVIYVATFFTVHHLRKTNTGITGYHFQPAPLSIIITVLFSWVLLCVLLSIFVYLYPEIEKVGYMAEDHKSIDIYRLLKVALVAPVFEELIFRGIVLDGFLKRYKPSIAIFFSALIFGIVHMDPVQGTFAFFGGLLLGWIFWKTRSLFLCMLLHVINNFMAGYDFEALKETDTDQETIRELFTPVQFYSMYLVAILMFIGCIYYINRYYKTRIKQQTTQL